MDETAGQTAYITFLRGEEKSPRQWSSAGRCLSSLPRSTKWVIRLAGVACLSLAVMWISKGDLEQLTTSVVEPSSFTAPRQSRPQNLAQWSNQDFSDEFDEFALEYGKSYSDQTERQRRLAIFRENLVYIHVHNKQEGSFSMKMNHLGDWSFDEFHSHYLSAPLREKSQGGLLGVGVNRRVDWDLLQSGEIPENLDWREKGCVTAVKDQEQCGSCWAFSATGAMEGAICAKTGILPNLSEQQLVDCASVQGNLGCNGGEADWAFKYIMENGGLCAENDYPYTGVGLGFCAENDCQKSSDINGFVDIPTHNAAALRAALARHGPVSVGIQADQIGFRFYSEGVFNAPCGTLLDHAVLAVGYGVEDGQEYFLVKNSWGTTWGADGYIKMAAHSPHNATVPDNGECGILLQPSYALP